MPDTLTERIRNGSGEDRELDFELWFYFNPNQAISRAKTPRYTSDLNAVFALVERELPGGSGERSNWTNDKTGRFVRWTLSGFYGQDIYKPYYKYADVHGEWWDVSVNCRALLLALLAAKEQG